MSGTQALAARSRVQLGPRTYNRIAMTMRLRLRVVIGKADASPKEVDRG
jgi:hypothetical protein